MGLPEGAPLEHVTVVSGRGGKRGLPEMYFGNASVGVCTGRLRAGAYGDVRGVRDAIRPGMRRALMRRSKFLMLTEATIRAWESAFDFDIDAVMEEDGGPTAAGLTSSCTSWIRRRHPGAALPPELSDLVQIQCSRPGADGEAAGKTAWRCSSTCRRASRRGSGRPRRGPSSRGSTEAGEGRGAKVESVVAIPHKVGTRPGRRL